MLVQKEIESVLSNFYTVWKKLIADTNFRWPKRLNLFLSLLDSLKFTPYSQADRYARKCSCRRISFIDFLPLMVTVIGGALVCPVDQVKINSNSCSEVTVLPRVFVEIGEA